MFRAGQWNYLASVAEAPRYALIAGYLHRLATPPGSDPVRVLDAGCGEGILADHLDPARIALTGFDPSPTAIARAQARPGIWLVAGVDPIPVPPSARFHAIVFNEVLPALPDPIGTLARYRALLEPGGMFILSLFQSPDEQANARILTRMLEAELAAGALEAIARASVTDSFSGLTWNLTCLR
jgi:2-polyprenyl-3-methyl-5-hydroxy-6-metoxy-1,4-benzoquinol methylase